MHRKHTSKNIVIIICLFTGLVALALSQTLPAVMAKTIQPTARQQVAQAIDQASESGQYRYNTTVVQTYHPTLLLENVGRTTRVETHQINGEVDVPADSMTMQIKAASNPSLQIKIEDGRGYGRFGEDDEWIEVDLATDLFAPGGDPMGFLAAAENVHITNDSLADGTFPADLLPVSLTSNITRYQFDVNGQKYAVAIRDQLEEQLISSGELPPGINLQLAQRYVEMTGSGEFWVYKGADGSELPMRQIVQLDFPAETGASEWVSAEITTAFTDWSKPTEEMVVANWSQDPLGTARTLAAAIFGNLSAETVRQVASNGGIMLLLIGGGALFFVNGRRREVRIALNLTIVVSMLVVPLLQARQANAQSEQITAFNERQLARQEDFSQTQAAPAAAPAALPPTIPFQAPALASSCVITATSDCDGDGLTDNVERYEIGTNIEKVDTDGDGVTDCIDTCPNTPGQIGSPCNDGNAQTVNDVLDAGCVCAGTVATDVLVSPRVILDGPYNPSLGLMADGMRALGLVPTIEPYTGLGYAHVGGGGETTSPAVLAIAGSDAIVDWVLLEARSSADPTIVVATRSALVQRDGDVVDVDGASPVSFDLAPGNYHIAALHRNHLACMTAASVALSTTPVTVDLTNSTTPTYGTDARKAVDGKMVLWGGDVTFDGQLIYTGQNNDRDPILSAIGGTIPTATITGYRSEDVNLDGTVIYSGLNNDRDPILQNIGGTVPTATRLEQLP